MTSYDISTYVGLMNTIIAYTESNEPTFVANIPTFIQNAERLINNQVDMPAAKQVATLTTVLNSPYVTLPTNFLAMHSLAVISSDGQFSFLLNKDINYIRECFPYPAAMGLPTTYALYSATQFFLGPTPNAVYPMELQYFAYPTSIVTAGTSWLGTNYPNALLWGSLVEAYVYLKGETDLIQTYQAKFEEAMAPLKQLIDGKDRQDNYRVVQPRDKVV